MTLRKATGEDIESILMIDHEVLQTNWSEVLYLEAMILKDNYFYVLDLEGVCIGFILFRSLGDDAEVLQNAVQKDYQNFGFGKVMLEKMIQKVHSKGLKYLYLEVSEHNTPAYEFYRKYGFERIHVRKNYYGISDDALVMRKDLEQ